MWIIFVVSAMCALAVSLTARDVWHALTQTAQNSLPDLTCNCSEVTALHKALWESSDKEEGDCGS